jgi:hypothetical protein
MHLRGGVGPDGTRVLSESSVRAMQEPAAVCPEPELLGDHWGLGWFLRTSEGPTVFGHDGNTHGITSCLRIIPERDAAWALLMDLSGQNWAAMEVAHGGLDERFGTVTPGQPAPSGASAGTTAPYVGTYQSVASTLVVTATDGGLQLAVTQIGMPEDAPPMEGALLPAGEPRFVLRMPALGDDLPLTFMEQSGDGYNYIHMGARLYRRV